jgi:hypothetical protein
LLPCLLSPDRALARRRAGLEIDVDSESVAEFDVELRVSNKVWESSHGMLVVESRTGGSTPDRSALVLTRDP